MVKRHNDQRSPAADHDGRGRLVQRRLDGIEDSILPNRPPAVISNATGVHRSTWPNGPSGQRCQSAVPRSCFPTFRPLLFVFELTKRQAIVNKSRRESRSIRDSRTSTVG